MYDTLLGAFAQILPERIPAANEGGSSAPHIAGRHKDNTPFMISGGLMGCWGGSKARDGRLSQSQQLEVQGLELGCPGAARR